MSAIISQENTIYALCIDTDMVFHFKTSNEAEYYRDKFNTGKKICCVEKTPEIEEQIGLQERFLTKMTGFLPENNKKTINNSWEDVYIASRYLNNPTFQMEAAMGWIENMSSREFQDRLLQGELPVFARAADLHLPFRIERQTNHAYYLMTENCHRIGLYNQGYLNRGELRYRDVNYFKKKYYKEFTMPIILLLELKKKIKDFEDH